MRTCHFAGLAVVWACALVSVPAVAGPPPFVDPFSPMLHYQFKSKFEAFGAGGCENLSDGTSCWGMYVDGDGFVSMYDVERGDTFLRYRYLYCYSVPGTFAVGGGARTASYDALIDVNMQGCNNFSYSEDFITGEKGIWLFPDAMLIRALFMHPAVWNSSNSQGHSYNVDGTRENITCQNDGSDNFQDGSVEINGSSKPVESSGAVVQRCNQLGKQ